MDVQFGPNSVDEPNLQYKLQHKVKVFNTNDPLPNRGYNLITSASKYGIVFVACPNSTLSVYSLCDLIDKESDQQYLSVKLLEKPTHIAVSCDDELLAVTSGQLLLVYNVVHFQNQDVSPSICIKTEVNPSTYVSALQWNPCIPDTIAIAFFDGTLLISQVSSMQVKKIQSKARCICWSPKGKQLVTGNSDGTLMQYKPDLSPMKTVPPPNLCEGAPVEALAIHWIATFQFAVVYRNASGNSRPAVTIINTPKGGQPSCVNYEDICFSMGSNRPWYYYLVGLAQWNMILSSSSNSMEIATLASTDGTNWVQWSQSDEARPELPLTNKKIENYPVGVCIDTCAVHQLPWGENQTLPYMPLLHVVSQTGLLTMFNIVNLNNSAQQVCTPPKQLVLPAHALCSDIPGEAPTLQVAAVEKPPTESKVQHEAQPLAKPQPTQAPTAQFPTSAFGAASNVFGAASKAFGQPAGNQAIPAATLPTMEPPKQPETKQIPAAVPLPPQPTQPQQKPAAPTLVPKAQTPVTELSEAEIETINRQKAHKLKEMLITEVNAFQMELYKFVCKTRETQIKLQNDLNSMDPTPELQRLDTEQLKRECSLEELRTATIHLKLELVRACAVVAEARTHAEAKDLEEWTQTDPLTTKRVASIKKLAYYVQNQLQQAQKALDYKWNEHVTKDPQYYKPGERMIRPILDDVYQPLVKQQEILNRQEVVLRTLRSLLKECDNTPMFKSQSLLRSSVKSKDPLSKLTKNILNMSIEPQTKPRQNLSAQKLDALRDMLSNRKVIKIKPVNSELSQHLAALKLSYERSLEDKIKERPHTNAKQEQQKDMAKQSPIGITCSVQTGTIKPAVPSYSYSAQPSTVRTLFGEEPAKETPKHLQQQSFAKISTPAFSPFASTPLNSNQAPQKPSFGLSQSAFGAKPTIASTQNNSNQPFSQASSTRPFSQSSSGQPFSQSTFGTPKSTNSGAPVSTASADSKNVLKSLLQSNSLPPELKSDANTFMGQKICSPTAFGAPAQLPSLFTSKPISGMSNMLNKLQPPPDKPQPLTKEFEETGEPDQTTKEKPITNLFLLKPPTNVPDLVKGQAKTEKLASEKENVVKPTAVKEVAKAPQKEVDEKENEQTATFTLKIPNKAAISNATKPATTPEEVTITSVPVKASEPDVTPKLEDNRSEKSEEFTKTSTAASLFGAANATSPVSKLQPAFGNTESSQPVTIKRELIAPKAEPAVSTAEPAASKSGPAVTLATSAQSPTSTAPSSPSASSLFGAAVASQSQSLFAPKSQASSIFASATTVSPPASVFGSTNQAFAVATTSSTPSSLTSVFGTATTVTITTSAFASSQAQSIFASAAANKPSVFSTTTPASPSSVFGSASTTPASPSSVFGSATTTTQSSIFGSPSTSPSSVFGAAATANQSVFAPATTQSVFGATTTQSSVFGSGSTFPPSSSQTPQGSIFGSPTATSQPSVFGAPSQTSVFGSSSPPPAQSSIFGSVTPTTQTSMFGTPTQSTQGSLFGTPTSTTQASVFGTPTQATQASVFGAPTTTQNGSLFGSAESNLFASASISTTNAPSPTSGGNIFGGSAFGGAGAGSNTNVFGGKSAFGQPNANVQASAIFGGATAFAQKPAAPAANLWGGGTSSGGGAFGGSAFGTQQTTQASIFGGGTGGAAGAGGSFSAPSSGPFGSPQQVPAFGSPQQQQAPAFGGSSTFGAKPAFGQPAAFGSPPGGGGFSSFGGGFNKSPSSGFGASATFGGSPSFGGTAFGGSSPGKAFAGTSPGFGTPTQSNATFENLATQNTLTFGNLAQQSGQAPQSKPTLASPSFTGWRS